MAEFLDNSVHKTWYAYDLSRFYRWQGRIPTRKARAARFKNSLSKVKLVHVRGQFVPSPVIFAGVLASNVPKVIINRNAISTR